MNINYWLISPEIVITATILLVLSLDLFLPEEKKRPSAYLSLLGVLVALILCFPLFYENQRLFGGMIIIDSFSVFMKIIFLVIIAVTIFLSFDYINKPRIYQGEYYFLLLCSALGMMLMASSGELITIFVALELVSLSSYVLAGFHKDDLKSNEASLKYFLIGVLATAVMLYGMSLLYGITGSTDLLTIARALKGIKGFNIGLITAVIFIIVGFGFKVAAVPFHFWCPDVYEGAPTPITAFLSVGPKAAGFVALMRILFIGLLGVKGIWIDVFIILSIITMTTGNLIALTQKNIKRMLAYSSIAHAGYILLCLAIATKEAFAAVLFYLAIYTFMNIGAFAVIIAISPDRKKDLIEDYAGLAKRAPFIAGAMSVFVFSLAGVPPLAGFIAKFYIIYAAVEKSFYWLVVIMMLNCVIALYYYANIARYMYLVEPKETGRVKIPPLLMVTIIIALILNIVPLIYPDILIHICRLATFI